VGVNVRYGVFASAVRTTIEKSIWSRPFPKPPAAARLAMIALDCGSTGALVTSRFHAGCAAIR